MDDDVHDQADRAAYWEPRTSPLADAHVHHQHRAMAEFDDYMAVIHSALVLIALGLEHESPHPWDGTFANEFGAIACFSRSHGSLRAATALAVSGYYTDVEPLLRSAYESASLGRMLAKQPELADKWLLQNEWTPDRIVRRWVEEERGPGEADAYAAYYRQASNATHPTAQAALRSIAFDDGSWAPRLQPTFDSDSVRALLGMCAGIAGFVCAALRNAAAVDEAIPEGLGAEIERVLADISSLTGASTSRNEKDWDAIAQKRIDVLHRVRPTTELDEELDRDPQSWRNLLREDSVADQEG